MEEKVDIVALGELLIDFTEAGHSQGGRKLFEHLLLEKLETICMVNF